MKKRYVFDIAILVIYLLVANPSVTGIPVHEWLGIGLILLFVVHLALSLDKVRAFLRSVRANGGFARGMRLLLVSVMLIALMVCAVSGIMVSGHVLLTFGFYANGYFFWDPLHAASAKVFLALLLIHLVLTAGQVLRAAKGSRGAGVAGAGELSVSNAGEPGVSDASVTGVSDTSSAAAVSDN